MFCAPLALLVEVFGILLAISSNEHDKKVLASREEIVIVSHLDITKEIEK